MFFEGFNVPLLSENKPQLFWENYYQSYHLIMITEQWGGVIMKKSLDILALTIGIIGAVNWGLIGFFRFNLVNSIFGNGGVARVIYALVGLCGLYLLSFYMKTGEVSAE